ncbi:delta-60 repeat domain-containing protein [Conexibacter stalactiti]|uniref:Delta-60 repeat domain-containing protein n=1 Tax=Conexibacter stalactiti TaxID=1940611 RepID=A0ABU4HYL0_9ACTN|nr:delta-60 repeat domain-containing protein [Conexibacter stalactiti]MDW5598416.1 delta-60 repeat domain-containing protein [Conexibacter stalactiti]MEC5039058.1 delta-60 repeat domain-containing protein [Conexibacter stalactiti]
MLRSLRIGAAACGATLALAASAPALAAPPPAALDPAFGDGGVALLPASGMRAAMDMAPTPDGGAVAVGYADAGGRHWVVKLDGRGAPDAAFGGGDGIAELTYDGVPAGGGGSDVAHRVAVDAAGRIVVLGDWGTFGDHVLSLARLLPDGSYDPSFDGDGRKLLTLDPAARFSSPEVLAVDSGGAITVVGAWRTVTPSLDPHFVSLVTLAADGTPTALPRTLFQIAMADVQALATAADGRIAFAGDAFIESLLTVRTAALAPAPGFPNPFLVDLGAEESPQSLLAVTFTPEGGVVAVGYALGDELREVGTTVSFPAAGGAPRIEQIVLPDPLWLQLHTVALVDGKPVAGGGASPERWSQSPVVIPLGADGRPDAARGGVQQVALPARIVRSGVERFSFTPDGHAFVLLVVADEAGLWSTAIAKLDAVPDVPGGGGGEPGPGGGGERPGPDEGEPTPPATPPTPPAPTPGGTTPKPSGSTPPRPKPGKPGTSPAPAARATFATVGRGPLRALRGTVAERATTVQVALVRAAGDGRCRALTSAAPRFAKPARCAPGRWLTVRANARGSWTLALGAALPPGRYRAWVRATPRPGRSARPFTRGARNEIAFTVR